MAAAAAGRERGRAWRRASGAGASGGGGGSRGTRGVGAAGCNARSAPGLPARPPSPPRGWHAGVHTLGLCPGGVRGEGPSGPGQGGGWRGPEPGQRRPLVRGGREGSAGGAARGPRHSGCRAQRGAAPPLAPARQPRSSPRGRALGSGGRRCGAGGSFSGDQPPRNRWVFLDPHRRLLVSLAERIEDTRK